MVELGNHGHSTCLFVAAMLLAISIAMVEKSHPDVTFPLQYSQ